MARLDGGTRIVRILAHPWLTRACEISDLPYDLFDFNLRVSGCFQDPETARSLPSQSRWLARISTGQRVADLTGTFRGGPELTMLLLLLINFGYINVSASCFCLGTCCSTLDIAATIDL